MASDLKYLRQKRGRWLVQVSIPTSLRSHFQKSNFEKYLGTSSLAEAQRRKHAVVAEIFDKLDRARLKRPLTKTELEGLENEKVAEWYKFLLDDPVDGPEGLSVYLLEMITI